MQLYTRVINGTDIKYPYNEVDLRLSRRDVCWPAGHLSNETLAEYGVYPVTVDAMPEFDASTHQCTATTPKQLSGNVWTQGWDVTPLSASQITANMQSAIVAFDTALTAHLDATARQRRYDSRITCMVRAGFAGPFQAEGKAFATWCDTCNMTAYQMLVAVQAGTEPIPESPQAFIATLPAMVWPE